eukprot:10845591-Alexandrium_andersonii.AAC.1
MWGIEWVNAWRGGGRVLAACGRALAVLAQAVGADGGAGVVGCRILAVCIAVIAMQRVSNTEPASGTACTICINNVLWRWAHWRDR